MKKKWLRRLFKFLAIILVLYLVSIVVPYLKYYDSDRVEKEEKTPLHIKGNAP